MSVREHDNGINNERRVLSTSPKEGKKEEWKEDSKAIFPNENTVGKYHETPLKPPSYSPLNPP